MNANAELLFRAPERGPPRTSPGVSAEAICQLIERMAEQAREIVDLKAKNLKLASKLDDPRFALDYPFGHPARMEAECRHTLNWYRIQDLKEDLERRGWTVQRAWMDCSGTRQREIATRLATTLHGEPLWEIARTHPVLGRLAAWTALIDTRDAMAEPPEAEQAAICPF